MSVKQQYYEELLAQYSSQKSALSLLKEYRPYLEMVPSMRRPNKSIISIPLPIAKVRNFHPSLGQQPKVNASGNLVRWPCDVAFLMCDPDWKIKTGVEIFIFIHRPHEDFSDLLERWRQTQLILGSDYEWLMPYRYRYILGEASEETHPLFVLFPATPKRISKGLKGAGLPFVIHQPIDDKTEPQVSKGLSVPEHQSEDLEELELPHPDEGLFSDGNPSNL